MTADPNEPQSELPLEQPAAVPEVDVDALADKMVEKLTAQAEARQPAAPAQPPPAPSEVATYKEMMARAADPTHPLHHDAVMHLAQLRRQGEEDEWDALGCPAGHPARALFRANPMAYSGRPIFAFQRWQLEELQAKTTSDAAKEQPKEEEPARAAPKAPGMPSRSVGTGKAKAGNSLRMTLQEFEERVRNEPELDNLADQGKIEWIT